MRYKDTARDAKARRSAALARPELRGQSVAYVRVTDRLPPIGQPVIAYASDGSIYKIPFPVCYRGDGKWSNIKFDRPLSTTIVGWTHVA